MEVLREALDAAGTGEAGAAVFVVGEAGVGKSRLIREAHAYGASHGVVTLSGRAVPTQAFAPLRPFAEALLGHFRGQRPPAKAELEPFRRVLGRLVPEWSDPGHDEAETSIVVLAEAVLRLLRSLAGSGGCLLVLEDLHWADPETLAVVEYLAQNVATEPVVVIATVRSEGGSAALDLARTLVAQRSAMVLDLASLTSDEVVAMACACLAVDKAPTAIEALVSDHTDGLPFLVEELLAGASESGALVPDGSGWTAAGVLQPDVPVTLLDSVDRRLAAMGDAAPVLIAASVLGRAFDWTLLPAITGRDDAEVLAAMRIALDAQLLIADSALTGTFRFRHALTRDAVSRRMMPMERAELCRRAADVIEAAHPTLTDGRCDLVANLAEQGGDRDRAARLFIESGRRCLDRAALDSAAAAFQRAAVLADQPDLAVHAEEGRCEALAQAGRLDEAFSAGAALLPLLARTGASNRRTCELHLRLARAAVAASRGDLVTEQLQLARAHADDALLMAHADVIEAQLELGVDDERAADLARSALLVAEDTEQNELRCEALELLGRCARRGTSEAARTAFERGLAVAEAHDLMMWRIRALSELAILDRFEGRGRDRMDLARGLALDAGAFATLANVEYQLAVWHLDQFEPEAGLERTDRCRELTRRLRLDRLHALATGVEAALLGQLGRQAEMEALAAEVLAMADGNRLFRGMLGAVCSARCALLQNDQREALRVYDASIADIRPLGQAPLPDFGLWTLLCVLHERDADAAMSELRSSGTLINRLNLGYLHLAEAVVHGRAGRTDRAVESFAEGDRSLEPWDWYRRQAHLLLAEAALVDGWGDPTTWLQKALPVFEDRDQERLVAACRTLLRRGGVAVPRQRTTSDPTVPGSLRGIGVTARELEVLVLLADGLSNKQIAERLYLSPRTVERHIANVNAKAGLRTRSELVAFAAKTTSPGS